MKKDALSTQWWNGLSGQWKKAFAETCFKHNNEPTADELAQLYNAPALRFAGPTAPYPNMSFELDDLSGIAALTGLETLVVTHHNITRVQELSSLKGLKHLFLFSNYLQSLEGINELTLLTQLYVQDNQITSILPVQKLVALKELYINNNEISSLEGLTEEHAENLGTFFCKPNDGLKQKELLQVERELGIRCRSL